MMSRWIIALLLIEFGPLAGNLFEVMDRVFVGI